MPPSWDNTHPTRLHLVIMADDHHREEDATLRWRNNVISRVKGVERDTQFLPHPSCGGSRGYDIPFREMILENYHTWHPFPESIMRSVRCWLKGHISCRRTGSKSHSKLSGHYFFLLVLFKMIWLHSSYYKCIAFIANETDNAKIFNKIIVLCPWK